MTIREDFASTYKSLSRLELQSGAHGLEELGIEDLFGNTNNLFLGFYTLEGLQTGFERYGLMRELAALGFDEVRLELNTDDRDEHLLRVWDANNDRDPLVELVARRGTIRPQEELASRIETEYLNILQVEWLQLQNPNLSFSPERPPLPGQTNPGLGIGLEVMELLRLGCKRLKLDGLATVPSYFHNALFYSEEFLFCDPQVQGAFLAACRDILPQTLASPAAASWAFLWSMVSEANEPDTPFPWFHDVQVAPISKRLQDFLDQPAYDREVKHALSSHTFHVMTGQLLNQLAVKGIQPLDREKIAAWIEA